VEGNKRGLGDSHISLFEMSKEGHGWDGRWMMSEGRKGRFGALHQT